MMWLILATRNDVIMIIQSGMNTTKYRMGQQRASEHVTMTDEEWGDRVASMNVGSPQKMQELAMILVYEGDAGDGADRSCAMKGTCDK